MALDAETRDLINEHVANREATRAVIFGRCWAESPWADHLRIDLQTGETPAAAAERLDLAWNPAWLVEAGYRIFDAAGVEVGLDGAATAGGPIAWEPAVRLPKVDDGVANDQEPGSPNHRRRLMGEVALASLWRAAAQTNGISDDIRPPNLQAGTRGSRFKNAIMFLCEKRLPAAWSAQAELRLHTIRGLHLRRDVGERKSDIAIFDPDGFFVAMVSSKWTWRSDRGTEAAQIIAMRRYRPDIPYLLATTEFPRSTSLVRESVEDLVFHTCPRWVGAWTALYRLPLGVGRQTYATLADLDDEGERVAGPLGVGILDLMNLPAKLADSGRVG